MKLIIAEKPSVAANIAAAVGAVKDRSYSKYWRSLDYIVTNCIGHLAELKMPEDYDPALHDWKLDTLPILPDYEFQVKKDVANQFGVVKNLMNDTQVDSIINACDAGREGENIFRKVYELAQCRKPVERLWVSSMEVPAIQEGMEHLKPSGEYDTLADAAQCREIADWCIGINLSRLYSLMYDANLSVGRCQTPVVKLIVDREQAIRNHVPTDYWIVTANFASFSATLRCDSSDLLEEVQEHCQSGSEGIVSQITSSEKAEKAPHLYNLAALQKDMNRYFGATASQTLNGLQNLYESKLATYPRTESKYITEHDADMAAGVLDDLLRSDLFPSSHQYAGAAPELSRIIDSSQVEDHPALLPTKSAIGKLKEQNTLEKQILTLLLFRLLEATLPDRIYDSTKIEVLISGRCFTASGVTEKRRGWKEAEDVKRKVLSLKASSKAKPVLPQLEKGCQVIVESLDTESKQTKPPERYTEASLIEDMENLGLGTAATRAEIVEKVILTGKKRRGLITRGKLDEKTGKGKDTIHLYPTEQAEAFITRLPDAVTSAATTSQWEQELTEIQQGKARPDSFVSGIEEFVRRCVEDGVSQYASGSVEKLPRQQTAPVNALCKCPKCGDNIISGKSKKAQKAYYTCQNKDCNMVLFSPFFERKITAAEAKTIFTTGKSDILYGFKSKKGTAYAAYLVLEHNDQGLTGNVKIQYLSNSPLCKCPICGDSIIPFYFPPKDGKEAAKGWCCKNRDCTLDRFYNPYRSRLFTEDEVTSLYKDGHTPMVTGLVGLSGQPYDAAIGLARDSNGKYTGRYEPILPSKKKK